MIWRLAIVVGVLAVGVWWLMTASDDLAERPKPPQAEAEPVPIAQAFVPAAIHLPPPPPLPKAQPEAAEASKPVVPIKPLKLQAEPLSKAIVPLKPSAQPREREPVETRAPSQPKTGQSNPKAPPEKVERAPEPAEPVIQADAQAATKTIAEGRVMLRLLEHGRGPLIEIAWPATGQDRQALFRRLQKCHGMMLAVMDDAGRLFRVGDPAGEAWDLNTDRISGFLRAPYGRLTTLEQQADQAIRSHHRLGSSGQGVRLFPRHMDARLLGGLQAVVGGQDAQLIQARYEQKGSELFITDIRINSQPRPGRVALGACR